jgi:CheY-like chemotaxis protein
MTPSDVTVLLVEDDVGHARLIEKNLRRSCVENRIVHLENGQDALDYVLDESHSSESLLLLLDLNMPGVSGFKVLETLKSKGETKHIPVVVLTTADDRGEVERCYQLGCNLYLNKPVDYESFAETIHQLGLFLSVVSVPEGAR